MSGNLQGENVWSGERERENNGFDLMRKNYYFFVSVSMYVQWRFRAGIEKQFLALQRGFNELMPTHLLKLFDEKELELVISGLGKVDVEDWKINTRLKGCSPDSKLVKWFWKVCLLALLSNVLFAWL